MISLKAKIRKDFGKKTKFIREADKIPAQVYGPGVKNASIEVDYKDFQKIFKQAGESSLIELKVEGEKEKRPVLIHEVQRDAITDKFIHIDFFQASLKEEAEAMVPLVFVGVSLAEKDLELRGSGNLFGTAQSGFTDFRFATLADVDLMKKARDWAGKIKLSEHPDLESKIEQQYQEVHFE